MADTLSDLVTFADIQAASQRLRGVAHRTPVITSNTLDGRIGGRAYLKCENFQRMGAFKFRGAYNRLAQLDLAERSRGVVTFSSGNHAQGVALAAKLLGIHAAIVMPKDAPRSKLDATRGYGAEVILYGRAEEDRDQIARGLCAERGATMVPPYDDRDIVAGQGTAVLELLQDHPEIDTLLICTGGGGLLSGSVLAANGINPAIEVYGVEPDSGNDFQQSLAAGRRIKIEVPNTIADGMQTQSPGELTFAIAKRYVRGILTVSDAELREAMRFAFSRLKIVIEPSGAAGLAVLLAGKIDAREKQVGIVVSGGNVDAHRFGELIAQ